MDGSAWICPSFPVSSPQNARKEKVPREKHDITFIGGKSWERHYKESSQYLDRSQRGGDDLLVLRYNLQSPNTLPSDILVGQYSLYSRSTLHTVFLDKLMTRYTLVHSFNFKGS